ncbi:MAG TPA: hypothetical protein VNX26_18495 [Candidatus Acidoferrum sp.]|jgi:hypothetical protein|nr:hypothetical protein [Candidatus Acidoferrum sp.]
MLPPELVNKIDDMMKADLLEWHRLWFGWLLTATALVVVGLTLEGGELWYEMRSISRSKFRFFRYRTVILERRVEWARIIAFIGWGLIVAGVAGEMFTEVMISDADRNIEAFDAIVLAENQREAAFAIEGAAQAQKENSELKITLIKLRRSSGWRYLSPQEQAELVKALRKYSKNRVVIEFKEGEEERKQFGGNFTTVFDKLHWNVSTWTPSGGLFSAGITIGVVDPSKPPPAALALKIALENLDFPFFSKIEKAPDAQEIKDGPRYFEVVIGENPQ